MLNYLSKYRIIREILNKALSITSCLGGGGGGGEGVEDFIPHFVLHKKLDVGHFSFFGGGPYQLNIRKCLILMCKEVGGGGGLGLG